MTFLSGQELPPLIIALPDGTRVFNPEASFPDGRSDYDGTGVANSGILVCLTETGPTLSYSLTFTVAGTYEYLDHFHPFMRGTVTVLPEGASSPFSQETYDSIANRERLTFINEINSVRIGPRPIIGKPDGTSEHKLLAGISTTRVDLMRFPEPEIFIFTGDTVTWSWDRSQAPHTVTFVPEGEEIPTLVLQEPRTGGPLPLVLDPVVFLPAGGDTMPGDGGLTSSGFRLNPELDPDSPGDYSLRFMQPGTYNYVCLIHFEQGHVGSVGVTGPPPTPTPTPTPTPVPPEPVAPTIGLPSGGGYSPDPVVGALAGLLALALVAAGGFMIRRRKGA